LTSRGSDAARLPGERALIEHIRSRLPSPPKSLIVGPGDDAAVVAPERGALLVLTTDALVEGIHFDRRFSSFSDVGYKALAISLSDIAAMGASPEFALLSLILPDRTTLEEIDALLNGLLELAGTARIALAGGNISRSPGPLAVDVTVTGSVRPRRILTRGGGNPGDALYLTGSIGRAAAGLGLLRAQSRESSEDGRADCIQRHRRPEPRVRAGMLLGRNRAASACIDLSDGLADAVRQLAKASGTGALIDQATLPIDAAAAEWFVTQGMDPVTAALSGGDDYELLFAVPAKLRGPLKAVRAAIGGLPLTRIGELTRDRNVLLSRAGQTTEMPAGFEHFRT
jgi:thiamine-monophosphate kinase